MIDENSVEASHIKDIKYGHFGHFKATFEGLQVVVSVVKRVKQLGMSDFSREDLETLYRVRKHKNASESASAKKSVC